MYSSQAHLAIIGASHDGDHLGIAGCDVRFTYSTRGIIRRADVLGAVHTCARQEKAGNIETWVYSKQQQIADAYNGRT